MTALQAGAALAAAGDNHEALFDFAPWWVRLIAGIIMVAIAGILYWWDNRPTTNENAQASQGWDISDIIQMVFGFGGLYVILGALGVF